MKKLFFITLILFSFSLTACTRDSSKTSENKKPADNTEKKQEQVNNNTTSGDNRTSQNVQSSANESAGQNSRGDLPTFTQKVYKKTYKGCNEAKEDCAHISFYNLEMTEGKYMKQINESLRDNALSAYSIEDEHLTDFDKIMDRFMKDYEQFKKEVPDAPGGWYLNDSTAVVNNSSDILCVKNTMENYLGGAHGAYNVTYTNFDMRTGNVLYVKDIFTPGSDKKLNKLIEQGIRKHLEMKPGETLQDGGLFENTVSANENFAITKEGIEFLYNQYEIAPYAFGVIEVKLSYKELDDILNKKVINR